MGAMAVVKADARAEFARERADMRTRVREEEENISERERS